MSRIVFVLNNGDFVPASAWSGELAFPTHHPRLALLYLLRRYVLPHPSDLPPIADNTTGGTEWEPAFARMQKQLGRPVTVLLYSDRFLLRDKRKWSHATAAIKAYAADPANHLRVIDLTPAWNHALYRDTVHPNVMGNRVLARYVAQACR